ALVAERSKEPAETVKRVELVSEQSDPAFIVDPGGSILKRAGENRFPFLLKSFSDVPFIRENGSIARVPAACYSLDELGFRDWFHIHGRIEASKACKFTIDMCKECSSELVRGQSPNQRWPVEGLQMKGIEDAKEVLVPR